MTYLRTSSKAIGWHDRGYLPHFDGGTVAQSITFRLYDALPHTMLEQWRRELVRESEQIDEEVLQRVDAFLDRGLGSCYLKDPRVANLVQDALLHFEGERYCLSAWVIMPNHVHLLITPLEYSLSRIMHSIKSYTAQEANKILQRKGPFWLEDYYDRYIRDARHFANAIRYIENNPVKAGLCNSPQEWRWSSAWFRARMVTSQ